MAKGRPGYLSANRTESGAPLAQFLNSDNKHISGVLYSAAHLWQTALAPGHDFIYIQNPHSEDLAAKFSSFAQWTRDAEGRVSRRQPKNSSGPNQA
jgi:hypothetical protein